MKAYRDLPELLMDVVVMDENKVVDPKSLLLLSNREYTLHVTLRLKKPVPQRVNAPRFKKPKNYSYFVVVENQRGEVLVGVCWWRDV